MQLRRWISDGEVDNLIGPVSITMDDELDSHVDVATRQSLQTDTVMTADLSVTDSRTPRELQFILQTIVVFYQSPD